MPGVIKPTLYRQCLNKYYFWWHNPHVKSLKSQYFSFHDFGNILIEFTIYILKIFLIAIKCTRILLLLEKEPILRGKFKLFLECYLYILDRCKHHPFSLYIYSEACRTYVENTVRTEFCCRIYICGFILLS